MKEADGLRQKTNCDVVQQVNNRNCAYFPSRTSKKSGVDMKEADGLQTQDCSSVVQHQKLSILLIKNKKQTNKL